MDGIFEIKRNFGNRSLSCDRNLVDEIAARFEKSGNRPVVSDDQNTEDSDPMRVSKFVGLSVVILGLSVLLASCATYVVRSYPVHRAALTGRIVFIPGNDPEFPAWNGARAESVEVTVRNLNTGVVHVVRTDREGYFRLARFSYGPYVITRYSYRILTPRGTWVLRTYTPRDPYRFVIREGFAGDLGTITWYARRGRVEEWRGR